MTEVTLIAGGTAGVAAIENYNDQMWRSFGCLDCSKQYPGLLAGVMLA